MDLVKTEIMNLSQDQSFLTGATYGNEGGV